MFLEVVEMALRNAGEEALIENRWFHLSPDQLAPGLRVLDRKNSEGCRWQGDNT